MNSPRPSPPPPAGASSLIEDLRQADRLQRAAQHLSRSWRVRPLFLWLAGIIGAAGSGSVGWIVSKVDTLHDLQAIRVELGAIRRAQDTQAQAFTALLDEQQNPPGRLIRLERGQRHVYRAILEARTSAYAGEPAKARALKLAEAERMADSYDGRIDDGAKPLAAYEEIVRKVAVR